MNFIFWPTMSKSIHTKQYAVLLELLLEARSKTEVKQRQLAERLQMTQSSISKVERGERRLDVIELRAWCKAIDASFLSMMAELDKRLNRGR
jgi:transcriptional regulator with XRE-family HTH domain